MVPKLREGVFMSVSTFFTPLPLLWEAAPILPI